MHKIFIYRENFDKVMKHLKSHPEHTVTLPMPYFENLVDEMYKQKSHLILKIKQASSLAQGFLQEKQRSAYEPNTYQSFKEKLIEALIQMKEASENLQQDIYWLERKLAELKEKFVVRVQSK